MTEIYQIQSFVNYGATLNLIVIEIHDCYCVQVRRAARDLAERAWKERFIYSTLFATRGQHHVGTLWNYTALHFGSQIYYARVQCQL